MKIIVSVSTENSTPAEDTRRLQLLFRRWGGYPMELCIGHWRGKREPSVIVHLPHVSNSHAAELAKDMLHALEQEALYFEANGRGCLLSLKAGGTVSLGRELNTLLCSWQGPKPDAYTETFDGRMIVAQGGL